MARSAIAISLALVVSTAGAASCQDPTQVMVRITTDVPCDQLKGVTLTVGRIGDVETKGSTATTIECTGPELGTLAVTPSGAKDDEVTIKVVAGVKRDAESCVAPAYGTGCIVARRTVRYVENSKLPIVVILRSSCNGVICAADQTCVNGGCASATVDSATCEGGCGESGLKAAGPAQPPSPLVCGDMAGLQSASPWPMLGGCPTHVGRSGQVGPQSNKVLWKGVAGGGVTSGVSIAADGTVYAAANDNKLYAFDDKGGVKWSTPLGSTSVTTVPAIGREGTIYVGNDDKKLYALSPTGAIVWQRDIGGKLFTSPVVGPDGAIYVGGGEGQSSLFALNPDGNTRWTFPSGKDMASSPAIGLTGTIFAASKDQKLYAVNPDATSKWTFEVGEPAETPVVHSNGFVYFAGKNSVCAVDPNGVLRWVKQTKSDATTPAIGGDGTVYAIDTDGTLYAFDGATGNPKWGTLLGPAAWATQPIIGGDGTIYVGSMNGTFYAVGPDGNKKWELATGGPIRGPAAIGRDGTLYFGSDDKNLYAVGR